MKTFRKAGWQIGSDGVPFIYKDPDDAVYYEINIAIKGTSISAGPAWDTNGVTITDTTSSVADGILTVTSKVAKTGEATLTFTDNIGNEEAQTFRWKYRDR